MGNLIKEGFRKLKEKFIRKGFWLTPQNVKDIEAEAKKNWPSESALARHIFTQWFKK